MAASNDSFGRAGQNRLGQEKSPYLLQHQNNPVWWYAWGEEAFTAAATQNKPIFLSIGYSTCYWCHVMEKDSFEQDQVADVLNQQFICIKVDREERPDVDELYMQAVVALSGRGGWPMSVFLTPELKPFWGGTYFPRAQFLSVLSQISSAWNERRDKISESADSLTAFLRHVEVEPVHAALTQEPLRLAQVQLRRSFDEEYGGFGSAPKFPPSSQLALLLRLFRRSGREEIKTSIVRSLDAMSRGGLYDQLGGGFHRYSTDAAWLVPHFEKMLYDNALLASLYVDAYRLFGNQAWGDVAKETLDYLERDMRSPDGAFYAAEDAGEVGKEGEFYVWKYSEILELLEPREAQDFCKHHGVSEAGNFEQGANVLTFHPDADWEDRTEGDLASARRKMIAARAKRARPHRDEKILLGWNALAVSAFCHAFQAFQEERYLGAAQTCMRFLRDRLYRGGQLLRRYKDGDSRFNACQEDYAYLIAALVDLYESDFDEGWLAWALELQNQQDGLFWDESGGGYFFSNAPELPARRKELIDGATPSGNSIALMNLLRLNALFNKTGFETKAKSLFACFAPLADRHPSAVSRALHAYDFALDRPKEVAIIRGGAGEDLVRLVQQGFYPNKVLCCSAGPILEEPFVPLLRARLAIDGKTSAYVCEHGNCGLPIIDSRALIARLVDYLPLYE